MASFRLKHSMEVSITVATTVLPHENPNRVVDSVLALFPQWNCDEIPEVHGFPSKRDAVRLVGQAQTLDVIIEGATKQRILDTGNAKCESLHGHGLARRTVVGRPHRKDSRRHHSRG